MSSWLYIVFSLSSPSLVSIRIWVMNVYVVDLVIIFLVHYSPIVSMSSYYIACSYFLTFSVINRTEDSRCVMIYVVVTVNVIWVNFYLTSACGTFSDSSMLLPSSDMLVVPLIGKWWNNILRLQLFWTLYPLKTVSCRCR